MKSKEEYGSKVSIVVPIFNAAPYLSACLDSIIHQTYSNIEIICVDDGSTDNSYDIIKKYMDIDNRISAIKQNNLYAGVARNHGFELSTGDYVMFLDADDIFSDQLVERMLNAVKQDDADIGICKEIGLDDVTGLQHNLFAASLDELDIPIGKCFSVNNIPDKIFQLSETWAWDKIYKSSFLREKNIKFQNTRVINDAMFCCVAYAEAEKIIALSDILITHRTYVKSSLEYNRSPYWKCAYDMFDCLYDELDRRGLFPKVKRSYYNLVAERIIYYVSTILDSQYFHESYRFYHDFAKDKYRFNLYSKDYFHDPYVYQKLRDMDEMNEFEYLCSVRKELQNSVIDRFRDVWYLQSRVEELESRIDYLSGVKRAKKWHVPLSKFKNGTKLILYGFGDMGKDYYNEIIESGRMKLIGVIDKNQETIKENPDVAILDVNNVLSYEFDYVLIAIFRFEIAMEIKDDLNKKGITPDRILWFNQREKTWI